MNILQTIQNSTGITFKKKSSTEFAGPCPWCSGVDRFSIIPEQEHYVCRRCKKSGDLIQFFRDYHHQTYFEACMSIGVKPYINHTSLNTATEKPGQNEFQWKPRENTYPPDLWQEKATAIAFEAFKFLMSAQGKKYREYLNLRGISNNTLKIARIGYHASGSTFLKESWGVTPTKNNQSVEGQKTNVNDKIWIPSGILIPQFKKNKVIRLRIRQENPKKTGRYIIVKGSATGYFNYNDHIIQTNQEKTYKKQEIQNTTKKNADISDNAKIIQKQIQKPILITESEFDGWLLHQELSDLFQVYSIGNSSARPDQQTHDNISNNAILLNLDDDNAGHEEVQWWESKYKNVKTHYSEFGKDVGESFEVGVNIRSWGIAGYRKIKDIQNKIIKDQNQNNSNAATKNINTSFKKDIIEKLKKRKQENNITPDEFFNSKIENSSQKDTARIQIQDKNIKQENNLYQAPVKSSSDIAKKSIYKAESKSGNNHNQICIHNQFCFSLNNTTCMIDNKDIWDNNKKCPKNQWHRYNSESGIITQIILAPGARVY